MRPVLGSYVKAWPRHAPAPEPISVEAVPTVVLDEPVRKPTVGRPWELDTFTPPSPGRVLKPQEKAGLGAVAIALIVTGVFMVRPEPLREETASWIALAGTGKVADEVNANDFAKTFFLNLGAEWNPRVFFQNLAPACWPPSAGRANDLVRQYTEGFDALRTHGRLFSVDFTELHSRPNPDIVDAPPKPGESVDLPCTLEFADGTALRASIRLVLSAEPRRWSILRLSIQPMLP